MVAVFACCPVAARPSAQMRADGFPSLRRPAWVALPGRQCALEEHFDAGRIGVWREVMAGKICFHLHSNRTNVLCQVPSEEE
jgi:hypothetical protein